MSDDAPETTAQRTIAPPGDTPIPQTLSDERGRDNHNIRATPAKYTLSGTRQYGTNFPSHTAIKGDLAKETAGLYYGPVPVDDFLGRLLPPDPKSPNPPRPKGGEAFKDVFKQPKAGTKSNNEDTLYAPFVDAATSLVLSLKVVATPNSASDPSKLRPDISFYPHDANVPERKADFRSMEMFAEFKREKSIDPFDDKRQEPTKHHLYPFEDPDVEAIDNRGQIAAYASTMFRSQFRTRVFAFGIYGNTARLYSWDPSAIVVSEAFDYAVTNHLAEFLWRFNWMSPDKRGIDATITRIYNLDSIAQHVTREELDYLRGLDNYGHQRNVITDASRARHRHFAFISVPGSIGMDRFIISHPPKLEHWSPLGRQARTMHGFDIKDKKFVLIKQYWRCVVDGILSESSVYQKMHAVDVVNLPKFCIGGDLQTPFASTRNQSLRTGPLQKTTRQTQELRLHRLALSVKATRITEFRSTKELVEVVIDAIRCYKDAAQKCKILHREINPGSVIIEAGTGRGMLVDWDSYGNADPATQHPRLRERVISTWQFSSVGLLKTLDGSISHTIADDMESFLWLLVWLSLSYTPYKEVEQLRVHLTIFDEVHESWKGPTKGCMRGGMLKRDFLTDTDGFKRFTFERGNALSNVISSLMQGFKARYEKPHPQLGAATGHKADVAAYMDFLGVLATPDWTLNILDAGLTNEK